MSRGPRRNGRLSRPLGSPGLGVEEWAVRQKEGGGEGGVLGDAGPAPDHTRTEAGRADPGTCPHRCATVPPV